MTFQTASKAQVQALPEFTGDMQIDYDHEEQVRGVYRSSAPNMQQTAGVGSVGADSAPATKNTSQTIELEQGYDRNTYAIETVQGQVSIPIEQERVTIERIASTDTRSIGSGDVPFGVGESRIETYGEVPEIRKEAFVREEIKIHKEIERETVTAQEQVRHQELDIQTQRSPEIDSPEERLRQRGTQQGLNRDRDRN